MSKSEVIQNLLDELNNQNQIYIAIIGTILAVLGLAFTIFSFMQRRFSDKQIQKMEDDFKKDFEIEERKVDFQELTEAVHGTLDIVSRVTNELEKSTKVEKELQKQIVSAMNSNLESKASLLEAISVLSDLSIINNRLEGLNNTLADVKDRVVQKTLDTVLVLTTNGMMRIKENITKRDVKLTDKAIEYMNSIEHQFNEVVENTLKTDTDPKLKNSIKVANQDLITKISNVIS